MWALHAGTSLGRFWSSRMPWALLLPRRRRMQARRGAARAPMPEAWKWMSWALYLRRSKSLQARRGSAWAPVPEKLRHTILACRECKVL